MMPSLSVGQVTAHAPWPFWGAQVSLRTSGQNIVIPVRMGFHNSADALRTKQTALPGLGTWGIIAFPYGDVRNATWLCSYHPSMLSAFTTNDDALDPFMEYEADFSGHWSSRNGSGYTATQWADGSFMVAGATSGLPTTYRTVVSSGQVPERIPYTRADRIPNPPAPFWFAFESAGGASLTVDPSGNTTVTAPSGASLDLNVGTSQIAMSSGMITLKVGSTMLVVSAMGVMLNAPLVSAAEGTFNSIPVSTHAHSGVTVGTGDTSGPLP